LTRARKAKVGMLEICDSIIASFPTVDAETIERAKLQHERGELVDFETLFNGLQGVQH
jgi:hypothetical protein